MKKYSTWLIMTSTVTLFILILSSIIGKYAIITPIYNKALFEIHPSITRIVVGASHSATSIDTTNIPETLSVAKSGEPLFFTYYKTKMLLENNPHIKDVVIAISPIHIAPYSDKFIFQDTAGSREKAMDYFFLIDNLSDPLINKVSADFLLSYLKFEWGLPFNYMSDLKISANYYTNNINFSDYEFWGGVERVRGNHIEHDRIIEKAKFYFNDGDNVGSSDVGIEVIKRISSLTEEFDIKLTIISTPMHPFFIKQIPIIIQDTYDEVIESVHKNNEKIQFINLSETPLSESNFLDGDHLNEKGISEFTQLLTTKYLK